MPNNTITSVGDLQGVAGAILPQVKIYGSYAVSTIAWLILIVIFLVVAGVVAYIVIERRKYRNTIIIFEKINNRWVDTGRDKAMELPFGDLGMKILYCKKHKKYLPKPSQQSGVRKFYFRIRSDGNWENVEFKDDEYKDILSFYSVEKNITERNVGIRKGLEGRYKSMSAWSQYAPIIISVIFILVVGVCAYLIFDKWIGLANATEDSMKTATQVLEKTDNILGKLDNICTKTSGSGIVPAGGG